MSIKRTIDRQKNQIISEDINGQLITYPLPTFIVDSREQNPYLFKAVNELGAVDTLCLDFGDYAIKDHLDLIVVERKKDFIEFYGNLIKNRDRFENELQRMQSCKYKYIIIEDRLNSLFSIGYVINKKSGRRAMANTNTVMASMLSMMLKYDVNIIFADNRKNGQQITRALLIRAYEYRMEGRI